MLDCNTDTSLPNMCSKWSDCIPTDSIERQSNFGGKAFPRKAAEYHLLSTDLELTVATDQTYTLLNPVSESVNDGL